MNLCGSDIVTIIIIAISLGTAILNAKKKEVRKQSHPEVLSDEDYYTVSDTLREKAEGTAAPGTKYEPLQVNTNSEILPDVEKKPEQPRRMVIDKKNLVIYSEIMKPKFD